MTDPVRCGLVKAVCLKAGTFEWVTPDCKESYENGLGLETMKKDMAVSAAPAAAAAAETAAVVAAAETVNAPAEAATNSAHKKRSSCSPCTNCMII